MVSVVETVYKHGFWKVEQIKRFVESKSLKGFAKIEKVVKQHFYGYSQNPFLFKVIWDPKYMNIC